MKIKFGNIFESSTLYKKPLKKPDIMIWPVRKTRVHPQGLCVNINGIETSGYNEGLKGYLAKGVEIIIPKKELIKALKHMETMESF